MACPAPAVLGTVNAQTARSAPTCIERQLLLLASEVSGSASSASDRAIRYQVPVAVPAGSVRVAEPVLLAPALKAGTLRLPSAMSVASSVLSLDKKKRVTEAATAAPPWFLVVSVAVMLRP